MKKLILLILTMIFCRPVFAISEFDRAMGFVANDASMGTFLKEIEAQIEKMHAEYERDKAVYLRDLQTRSQEAARVVLQKFAELNDQMIVQYEQLIVRAKRVREESQNAFSICAGWQKKSAIEALTFANLVADLQLQAEIDENLQQDLQKQCTDPSSSVCQLANLISQAIAEREKQAKIIQGMNDTIAKSEIEKICSILSLQSFSAVEAEQKLESKIKRLQTMKRSLSEKIKGFGP